MFCKQNFTQDQDIKAELLLSVGWATGREQLHKWLPSTDDQYHEPDIGAKGREFEKGTKQSPCS